MQDLMRIGISVPEQLMGRFDAIIGSLGYSSRSEGIRDAIRNYIRYEEWMSEVHGERIGIISFVYGEDHRAMVSGLVRVKHEYAGLTLTTVHKYLDTDNCMDVIVVRGEGDSIKRFVDKLMSLKGVKHVRLTTISPEDLV
ncbi:MAG TPA: nickel-responsive transcriptional regulator NikR [Methanocella sp.]|uniref:nickel-responsive transcriptional regulator NikR n=1 Tax=Methanocella sp. TaxID=2052833 RepID=UPI002D0D48B7|nr:nickel-responsive transcriptional regulator NikR [Methanocella sp.]HTY91985.1 nickel-responsive transcriptional regulator NikR [Methanocella sp.]